MATSTKMQDRANTAFRKKEERAREGAKAMDEYKAERAAVDKKIERLKALRLAKEAEDAVIAASAPPAKAKKPKAKKSAKKVTEKSTKKAAG